MSGSTRTAAAMTEPDYAQGGYIDGPAHWAVALHAEECVLAVREGKFVCVRDHETHDPRLGGWR
jgi:hypothetical protein